MSSRAGSSRVGASDPIGNRILASLFFGGAAGLFRPQVASRPASPWPDEGSSWRAVRIIWRALRLRTPRVGAICPRTGMRNETAKREGPRSRDVEADRQARESRAFRPAALARRGRASVLAEPLTPPRPLVLAAFWGIALALGALGFVLLSPHVHLRDLARTTAVGR